MSPDDAQLVADLILLGDRIPAIVDEVLAGTFDQEERQALSVVLATILAELDSRVVLPETGRLSG